VVLFKQVFIGSILGLVLMARLAPVLFGVEAASPVAPAMLVVDATPAVDGILGLPWGATREDVTMVMQEKGFRNIKVNEDHNDHSGSVSGDGSFAGYPAHISCRFIDNAMWQSKAEQICLSTDYAEGIKNYLKIRQQIFKDAPSLENPAGPNDSPDRIEFYLENQETDQGDNITSVIEFQFISARGEIEVSFENSTLKQRLLVQ
jgi:hypothetical protein